MSDVVDPESVDADDLNRAVDQYPEDYDDFDDDADDFDDDDGDDDDDDDLDDLDDADPDEIDYVVALYREDGQPVAMALMLDLANDFDELINQLRRLPGDFGALGVVSVASEFVVLVKVRGPHVQVLLSDSIAANDWPIARDVVYFLGEDVPDPDDDSESIGDIAMLEDLGLSSFDLENLMDDADLDSDVLGAYIAERIKYGPQFLKAAGLSPQFLKSAGLDR